MRKRSILALILAVIMLVAPMSVFAEGNMWSPVGEDNSSFSPWVDQKKVAELLRENFKAEEMNFPKLKDLLKENFKEDELVTFIVEIDRASGLEVANQRGVAFEDVRFSEETESLKMHEDILAEMKEAGINFTLKEQYTAVLNGFAVEMRVKDLERLEKVPNIQHVYYSNSFYPPSANANYRMLSSHDMINDKSAWDKGYAGQGSVVAVLDSGTDWMHPDMMKITDMSKAKLTEDSVNSLIREHGLKGMYFNEKVPYGYNYFDKNNDVKDSAPGASMHGMHVAGTVAANGAIKGVAPEAQILGMKVFGNDPLYGSTGDHIYVKAFDDAIKLGADVINMSLGSPAGFNEPDSATGKAITNAVENGIVFAISAGNEGSSVGDSRLTPYKPENPDISMVGSPSVYKDSTSVAAVENIKLRYEYLLAGEKKIGYMAAGEHEPTSLTGEYEYVDCGLGIDGVDDDGKPMEQRDFEGKELKGKIALIQRGVITFSLKIQNAAKHGAIATIIYNRKGENGIAGMSVSEITTPAIAISYEDGMYLKSKLEQQEAVKLSFPGKMDLFDSPNARLMSTFSSWGPTPTLELKPEISAPGGMIYSTVNDGQYEIMSGTSMAAPHVAGAYAVVNQYIRENLANFKYNKVTRNTNAGMKDIPNGSYIIGDKAFSELILKTSKSSMFYDALDKSANLIYKKGGKYFDKNGEVEFEMPAMMTYYNAHGEAFEINQDFGMSNGNISNEPLTKGDTTRLAKVLLMNTATVLTDQFKLIVSPRRQGAGMINVDAALTTPAVLLESTTNEPKAELGNLEDKKFDLNLRVVNMKNEDLTYKVHGVTLRDYIEKQEDGSFLSIAASVPMENAIVDAPEQVVVPANGFVDFTVSVNFEEESTYRNMYVEGFVQLADVSDSNPDLTMPFMGFYGHYSEPALFYPWAVLGEGKTKNVIGNPVDFGTWLSADFLGFNDPEMPMVVSPNVNKFIMEAAELPNYSSLMMFFGLQRNAVDLQYRLLDENGEREIGVFDWVSTRRKNSAGGKTQRFILGPGFDGTMNGHTLPDGKYMYEVRAKSPMNNAEWQSKKAPVIIDGTAPKFTAEVVGDKLVLQATDTASVYGMIVAPAGRDPIVKNYFQGVEFGYHRVGQKYVHEVLDIADLKDENNGLHVEVGFFDVYGNYSKKVVEYGSEDSQPNIYIESPEAFDTMTADRTSLEVKVHVFDVQLMPKLFINDKEFVDPTYGNVVVGDPKRPDRVGKAYTFKGTIEASDLQQGWNDVVFKAVSSDGKNVRSLIRTILVDTDAPMMTLETLDREAGSDTAKVLVKVSDSVSTIAKLFVNGNLVHRFDHDTEIGAVNGFSDEHVVELTLVDGENVFEFKLEDDFGNVTTETITIVK